MACGITSILKMVFQKYDMDIRYGVQKHNIFCIKKKNPLTITLRDINNIFINEKSMVILQTNYLK